jgi:proteic killer suppression protein
MEVSFAGATLRRCYESVAEARKRWGDKIARVYVRRIDLLYAAKCAGDLHAFPQLSIHPLDGDRRGQYAINLDGVWRLIVTFANTGRTTVKVEEVSKHHDD